VKCPCSRASICNISFLEMNSIFLIQFILYYDFEPHATDLGCPRYICIAHFQEVDSIFLMHFHLEYPHATDIGLMRLFHTFHLHRGSPC
jgi:hypothetical protein